MEFKKFTKSFMDEEKRYQFPLMKRVIEKALKTNDFREDIINIT